MGLDLTFRPERLEADVALELGFLRDVFVSCEIGYIEIENHC